MLFGLGKMPRGGREGSPGASLRVQGIVLATQAANGTYATTKAHDVELRCTRGTRGASRRLVVRGRMTAPVPDGDHAVLVVGRVGDRDQLVGAQGVGELGGLLEELGPARPGPTEDLEGHFAHGRILAAVGDPARVGIQVRGRAEALLRGSAVSVFEVCLLLLTNP